MSPAKTVAAFVISILCVLFLIDLAIMRLEPPAVWDRRYSEWGWLLPYHKRMDRFGKSPTPRRVMIGRSYASQLEEWDGFYNLAMGSLGPREAQAIIKKHCEPEDLVIYYVTPIEFFGEERMRSFLFDKFERQRLIITSRLQDSITPPPAITAKDKRNGERHLIYQLEKRDMAEVAGLILKLSEGHKNSVIVFAPIKPFSDLVDSKYEELKIHVIATGADSIDLTGAVSPDMFVDACHLTDAGNRRIRNALTKQIIIERG